LQKLICSDNQIAFVQAYPNLQILDCKCNQLTSLPVFPKLSLLSCEHNLLISVSVSQETKIGNIEDPGPIDQIPRVNVQRLDKGDPVLLVVPTIQQEQQATQTNTESGIGSETHSEPDSVSESGSETEADWARDDDCF